MKDVADYLAHVKSLIIPNPQVEQWQIVREAIEDDLGLFRYRLTLSDGSLDGWLRKRWDNAAHHPEVATHPHHLHEGSEDNVTPHEAVTAEEVLVMVTEGM